MSLIKWHLVHSIHSEHRGRTQKCPIQNHRVEYNHAKVVPVRIAIDKNGNLGECPIEFEVLQEFPVPGPAGAGSRDEKVSLGVVTLNLSEYVEESEAIIRDGLTPASRRISVITPLPSDRASSHHRKRSSMSGLTVGSGELHPSPRSSYPASELDEDQQHPTSDVQDGVVRRYLMQESKINSTLKLSILMLQTEGERNFVAPPLKTAPVFGGIAGFVANDALNEPVDAAAPLPPTASHVPSISHKSRDVAELQDMYRRALAASWASPPGELPADQCIEDIFAGGDGFRAAPTPPVPATSRQHQHQPSSSSSRQPHRDDSASTTSADDDDPTRAGGGGSTLRPRDLARLRLRLRGDSSGSNATVREGSHRDLTQLLHFHHSHHQHRDRDRGSERGSKDGAAVERDRDEQLHAGAAVTVATTTSPLRSRSESMASLAPTLASSGDSSERGRRSDGFKRAREVDEFEVREDLVAWAVPA